MGSGGGNNVDNTLKLILMLFEQRGEEEKLESPYKLLFCWLGSTLKLYTVNDSSKIVSMSGWSYIGHTSPTLLYSIIQSKKFGMVSYIMVALVGIDPCSTIFEINWIFL